MSDSVKKEPTVSTPLSGPGYLPPRTSDPRPVRLIRYSLWGLLLLTMAIVVGIKVFMPRPSNLPVLFPAAEFSLLDQDGKPISNRDLRGRPWAAAFIFTTCASTCPRITHTMADLQKKLPGEMVLVSFSVDPEYDTPARLKEYASNYHADESRWRFVTGPKEQVMGVIRDMKLAFKEADSQNPIMHSEQLLLVDADGLIRGVYESNDAEKMKQFVSDAATLARDAARGPIGRLLSRLNGAADPSSTNGPTGQGGS